MKQDKITIDLLDISECTYKERLTANCLQGLVNACGARCPGLWKLRTTPGPAKPTRPDDEGIGFGKYRESSTGTTWTTSSIISSEY